MTHIHVDKEAVLRLREAAKRMRAMAGTIGQDEHGFRSLGEELAELADHFAVVVSERDALQVRVDFAISRTKHYTEGYGYEGKIVADTIREALESK